MTHTTRPSLQTLILSLRTLIETRSVSFPNKVLMPFMILVSCNQVKRKNDVSVLDEGIDATYLVLVTKVLMPL